MRVVVTGAAGFVGSHVTARLLREGHDVVGVDCLRSVYDVASADNLGSFRSHPSFRLVPVDLAQDDLDPVLDRADAVMHLAGRPGVRPSWGDAFGRYLDDNVLATQRLAEAMGRVGMRRIVFASSSAVYGEMEGIPPVSEAAPCRPLSPYGVTKLAAENLLATYRERGSLEVVTLRYFTIYGPRQRPDMAIERFVTAALDDTVVDIYGDGMQRRDLTYVGDCVDATIAGLVLPAGVYNVAGGEAPTLLEILGTVQQVLGTRLWYRQASSAAGDVSVTIGDTSALRRLGFRPRTALRDGIAAQAQAAVARRAAMREEVSPRPPAAGRGRPAGDRDVPGTPLSRPVPAGLR